MSDKSIIVIGAGLAGLATGCYARMNGYHSHIFEHHSKAGGVAAAWHDGDYVIDDGIHFLMGHKPGQPLYDLYRELGIIPAVRILDMTTYGRFVDEAGGYWVDVTSDLDRLAAELRRLSPGDGRIVDDLVATARSLRGSPVLFDLGSQMPETGFLQQIEQVWRMRPMWKYFAGPYARPVAEFVRNVRHPVLRHLLQDLFLPAVPVWFVSMLLALLEDGQLGLLEGGCLDFVGAIEARYAALGGEVSYEATVEEILVENGRAVGVRLADGSRHRADVVVSAADGYSTIFEMLGGRYADDRTRRRYRTWKLIRPAVAASFGVARDFPGQPYLSLLRLKDPMAATGQAVPAMYVRLFNYSSRFAPAGKTVVQAGFESEWTPWEALQGDRASYEAEKERIAGQVLARLERHYPGISGAVERVDVATPYTTWRYTLNRQGAYMGWLPTPEALSTSIARTLPGLDNFYMAGQWVMPGGGVAPCLFSGKHAVQMICRQDGKPFVT